MTLSQGDKTSRIVERRSVKGWKRLMIKCYINDYADISKARDYD